MTAGAAADVLVMDPVRAFRVIVESTATIKAALTTAPGGENVMIGMGFAYVIHDSADRTAVKSRAQTFVLVAEISLLQTRMPA